MNLAKSLKPPDTHRLRFRNLELTDSYALYAGAFRIPAVTEFLQWDSHQDVAETEKLMREMISLHQQGSKFFWAAELKEDNRISGLVSVRPEQKAAWVGFLVCFEEQRKGLGFEIVAAAETAVLGVFDCVLASVAPANQGSIGLLKKRAWAEEPNDEVRPLLTFKKETK